MRREGLSTGEAARLCSVNPDTVLKWIRNNRLPATRTAGGHYRIKRRDLAALIPEAARAEAIGDELSGTNAHPLRCWEYLGRAGEIRDECRKCVVYQIHAAWCFRIATNLGCEIGQKQGFCSTPCEECPYYRRASGQPTNVLVITCDPDLVDALRSPQDTLALRFARNAYEASAAISEFRAAFVVIDEEVIADGQRDLVDLLIGDARLPGVRIIVAVTKGRTNRALVGGGNEVAATIEKPFGQTRVSEIVSRFPVEVAVA